MSFYPHIHVMDLLGYGKHTPYNHLLSYFFVKKIPLSRHIEYVMDGSVDHSVSE